MYTYIPALESSRYRTTFKLVEFMRLLKLSNPITMWLFALSSRARCIPINLPILRRWRKFQVVL